MTAETSRNYGANTFHCSPIVCPPCGNAAEQIQRAPVASWGDRIDQLAEPARECVRDYLRGIWMRGQVAERIRTELKGRGA